MSYSKSEKQFIFDMKRSIVNEFRYHKNFFSGIEELEHLEESFLLCLSEKEKKILKKLNFNELFSQALCELNCEEIIEFINDKEITITDLGFQRFVFPDKLYA